MRVALGGAAWAGLARANQRIDKFASAALGESEFESTVIIILTGRMGPAGLRNDLI